MRGIPPLLDRLQVPARLLDRPQQAQCRRLYRRVEPGRRLVCHRRYAGASPTPAPGLGAAPPRRSPGLGDAAPTRNPSDPPRRVGCKTCPRERGSGSLGKTCATLPCSRSAPSSRTATCPPRARTTSRSWVVTNKARPASRSLASKSVSSVRRAGSIPSLVRPQPVRANLSASRGTPAAGAPCRLRARKAYAERRLDPGRNGLAKSPRRPKRVAEVSSGPDRQPAGAVQVPWSAPAAGGRYGCATNCGGPPDWQQASPGHGDGCAPWPPCSPAAAPRLLAAAIRLLPLPEAPIRHKLSVLSGLAPKTMDWVIPVDIRSRAQSESATLSATRARKFQYLLRWRQT